MVFKAKKVMPRMRINLGEKKLQEEEIEKRRKATLSLIEKIPEKLDSKKKKAILNWLNEKLKDKIVSEKALEAIYKIEGKKAFETVKEFLKKTKDIDELKTASKILSKIGTNDAYNSLKEKLIELLNKGLEIEPLSLLNGPYTAKNIDFYSKLKDEYKNHIITSRQKRYYKKYVLYGLKKLTEAKD
jgi:predicted P-loop ATPase